GAQARPRGRAARGPAARGGARRRLTAGFAAGISRGVARRAGRDAVVRLCILGEVPLGKRAFSAPDAAPIPTFPRHAGEGETRGCVPLLRKTDAAPARLQR